MPLVEAANLTKLFRVESGSRLNGNAASLRAVDGVSLSVDAGETLGLVGESGCGKTTLGRCLIGLTRPTSGEILFGGRRVDNLPPADARKLCRERQIVFQDPFASLDPRWRIGAILEEPLRIHNIVPRAEWRDEIGRLLASVGLSADIASHYPHEFSGGQRQRIGIARALAVRPRFLVADEPVSALDVSIRAQILNLLADAQRERRLGMLFVTHDLGAVRHISHRIAVMYMGAIVETGLTEQIFANPRHPYTRTLLRAIPRLGESAPGQGERSGEGDVRSVLEREAGCRFRPRCPLADELCAAREPLLLPSSADVAHATACHRQDEI
ncbi:MAG: ATP-binding cassette domain-containing protein [Capsulimonadaceae bacterium]|nr:ATP-binding cassette domain-containing protein [Capsulimonadaceae bacterium]